MSRIGHWTALALAALFATGGWFALPELLGGAAGRLGVVPIASIVISFPLPWIAVRVFDVERSYLLYGCVLGNGLLWGFALAWAATKTGILPSWEEYDYAEYLEDEEFEDYDSEPEAAWQTWLRRATLPAIILSLPLLGLVVDRECFGLYDYVRTRFRAPNEEFSNADASRLAKMRFLRELDLSGTHIDDNALRYIRNLTRLEKIDLGDTPINGRVLNNLHGMRRLRELRLENSSVGNTGMEHLKNVTSLETLDLGGTNVSDRGVQSIATLPRLESLSLRGTRITGEALDALGDTRSLRFLDLRDTHINPARVKAFRGRNPWCRVEFP
jgi:hypothetical protein